MTALQTVTSADGSSIAFEMQGAGTPVIMIGGAFNDRSTTIALGAELAPQHAAISYDRRGRCDSTDASEPGSFASEREFEDIAALIEHVGGSAVLFGHSSGAVLAIEAVLHGLSVTALAVYEPPYVIDGTRPPMAADLLDRLRAFIAADRRDDATRLFLTAGVGVPPEAVEGMTAEPVWGLFTGLAHSLPYDVAVCQGYDVPVDRLKTIGIPTLAMAGTATDAWLQAGAAAVADAVPGARHVTLEGEDHGVLGNAAALLPPLTQFLG